MSQKWKRYVGEYPDDASSEDEDIVGVRPDGYTRSEMQERSAKLAEIDAFEKMRKVKVLNKAQHRGLMPSVRPRQGEYVTIVYDGKRLLRRIGDDEMDDALREMRRGERIEWSGGKELELAAVHEERALKTTSAWKVDGYVRKRRIACGNSKKRPKWGDTVLVRVLESVENLEIDQIESALSREDVREIVVGDGVEREGFETCLAAMKANEVAVVFVGGEYAETETDSKRNDWSAAVVLLEIRTKPTTDEDRVRSLKQRAGVLFAAGRHRRAEALYSRALIELDELYFQTPEDDPERKRVEDELAVPLLMNISLCARKRQCHDDEESLVTKALRLRHSPTPEFKAKAYLRRAAARIDLAKWKDAEDDLRIAASNTQTKNDDGKDSARAAARDVRRLLDRLNNARREERKAERKMYSAAAAEHDTEEKEKKAGKKKVLLYEKEIDARLKAQRPWEFDPDYHKITRAPRKPLEKSDAVLKEDNLREQYNSFDKEDEEYEKTKKMIERNWIMNAMYDTNGTGRRGQQPKGG